MPLQKFQYVQNNTAEPENNGVLSCDMYVTIFNISMFIKYIVFKSTILKTII